MTTRRSIIASALMVLPLAVARAAPAPDVQKITACLENANVKSTSGVECIGIIADPCIVAAAQKDTYLADEKACASRELAVWTARIASNNQSIGRHGKTFVAAATAGQKSLSDSIAKLCPVFDKIDPGMAPGGGTYCRMQVTAMWALQLNRLDNAASPH